MMTQAKIALVLALVLPVASFSLPALAASAHNTQTGAHTSNAYDTTETAALKQMNRDHATSQGFGFTDTSVQ